MGARRRVVIREDDILVVGQWELSAAMLQQIMEPGKRLLWEFIRSEDGTALQPICHSEDQCIWLTPADLDRTDDEVKDFCKE